LAFCRSYLDFIILCIIQLDPVIVKYWTKDDVDDLWFHTISVDRYIKSTVNGAWYNSLWTFYDSDILLMKRSPVIVLRNPLVNYGTDSLVVYGSLLDLYYTYPN